MANDATTTLSTDDASRLGSEFKRGGWIGFFLQLLFLIIPLLIAVNVALPFGSNSSASGGIGLRNLLAFLGLALMVFTTLWFFLYTRLGNRLKDPGRIPTLKQLSTVLWVGIWVSIVGIFFSVLLLFSSAVELMSVLLATPQTGLMLAPTAGSDVTQYISAMDVIALNHEVVTLTAELIVMGISLWLLFRVVQLKTAALEA